MNAKSSCERTGSCCLHQEPDESCPETVLVCRGDDGEPNYLPLGKFLRRPCALAVVWSRVVEIIDMEEAHRRRGGAATERTDDPFLP